MPDCRDARLHADSRDLHRIGANRPRDAPGLRDRRAARGAAALESFCGPGRRSHAVRRLGRSLDADERAGRVRCRCRRRARTAPRARDRRAREGDRSSAATSARLTTYPSDVKVKTAGGTDLTLKASAGTAMRSYFPIDGGVRAFRWSGVDRRHDRFPAQQGDRPARQGRARPQVDNGVRGRRAPARSRASPRLPRDALTDVFERLEFTHGHNVLLLDGLCGCRR